MTADIWVIKKCGSRANNFVVMRSTKYCMVVRTRGRWQIINCDPSIYPSSRMPHYITCATHINCNHGAQIPESNCPLRSAHMAQSFQRYLDPVRNPRNIHVFYNWRCIVGRSHDIRFGTRGTLNAEPPPIQTNSSLLGVRERKIHSIHYSKL